MIMKNSVLLYSGVLLLAGILQLHSCAAVTFNVGGASGWTIGPNYTQWAEKYTFHVNDKLFFAYRNYTHDVVEVHKSDYDTCNLTPKNPIFNDGSKGNTTVSLNKTGEHYYVCTYKEHCALGMKLAVKVVAAAKSPTPAPSTAPTPAPAPSKSGSKSPSPAPSPSSTPSESPSPAMKSPSPGPSTEGQSQAPASGPSMGPGGAGTSPPPSTTEGAAGPGASEGTLYGGFYGKAALLSVIAVLMFT